MEGWLESDGRNLGFGTGWEDNYCPYGIFSILAIAREWHRLVEWFESFSGWRKTS